MSVSALSARSANFSGPQLRAFFYSKPTPKYYSKRRLMKDNLNARDFLNKGISSGGFQTDDILSLLLPLFKQVEQVHQLGQVLPLHTLSDYSVINSTLSAPEASAQKPQLNAHLFQLEGEPQHLPNYQVWEWLFCEHHDPLTDIYLLGLILASFSLGLDFNDENDFEA